MKKESGVAGTRTHGRGSVPLMSKSDAIPLRHEAETFDKGKTTKYIVIVFVASNIFNFTLEFNEKLPLP